MPDTLAPVQRLRRHRRVSAFVGFFLLHALLPTYASAQALEARSFELSSDPGVVILRMSEPPAGLAVTDVPTLTLYADGRLVVERPAYLKQSGTYEKMLGSAELQALVKSLLDRGLGDFEVPTMRDRKQQLSRERAQAHFSDPTGPGATVSIVSDLGTTRIELALAGYAVGRSASQPLAKTIVWSGVEHDAELYPEVPELRALAEAVAELRSIMSSSDLVQTR